MLDESVLNEVCRCENPGCGDKELKHFEECPTCGSSAYHIAIKHSKELNKEVKQNVSD